MLFVLLLATATPAPAAAAVPVHARFDATDKAQLVPTLVEALRFSTVAGDDKARVAQGAWLKKKAADLGFTFREGLPQAPGTVVEIDLPGPPGAPVLALLVHGDVVNVEGAWSFPPFEAQIVDGMVRGRGAADDKGPLAQALMAMKALRESGIRLTHTVRLLVGSDEESGGEDMGAYLKQRPAPDVTLVLDSELPVVVGEMAWNALVVTADPAPLAPPGPHDLLALSLRAGTSASIVPDHAELLVKATPARWQVLADRLKSKQLDRGTTLSFASDKPGVSAITVTGRAAHSGVNIDNGRNALVSLAHLMDGELPPSGIDTLLSIARKAGADTHGNALGLHTVQAGWKPYNVNVGVVKPGDDDKTQLQLVINIRRPPPWTAEQLKHHVDGVVTGWLGERANSVGIDGWYKSEPLVFNPEGKLVKRLLDATERSLGIKMKPAISGGGTYARRLPNAIAFGMWFPDKPYPGHDVDETVPVDDLYRGCHVLIEAVVDIATGPPIVEPLLP